jgi:hypothetical protein
MSQTRTDKLSRTEMWVIFIVSCIPTIRPIFVKAFNKVYTSGSRTFATGGYQQQNDTGAGTHSRAYASRKGADSKSTSLPTHNDNESEENILPGQQGIMMTSQVVVKYEGSDSERTLGGTSGRKGEVDWKNHFDDSV